MVEHTNRFPHTGVTIMSGDTSRLTVEVIEDSGQFSRAGKSIGYRVKADGTQFFVDIHCHPTFHGASKPVGELVSAPPSIRSPLKFHVSPGHDAESLDVRIT